MKQTFLITVLLLSVQFLSAQSQSELAANMPEGKYTAYKAEGKKITATPKPWGVSFVKNGSTVTEITINRLGVVEENFKADLPESPAYFLFEGYRAIILDGHIFYYEFKNGTANIQYVLTPPKQ